MALVFSLIMLDYGFYAYEQAAEIPALFTGGISILSVVLAVLAIMAIVVLSTLVRIRIPTTVPTSFLSPKNMKAAA
jgi:hypothetical protein